MDIVLIRIQNIMIYVNRSKLCFTCFHRRNVGVEKPNGPTTSTRKMIKMLKSIFVDLIILMICVLAFILNATCSYPAQIVLIDSGTHRVGINNIGDIVDIHDDNVDLTGGGYDAFDVVIVHTSDDPITAVELKARLSALVIGEPTSKYKHKLSLNTPQRNALANGSYTKAQVFAFIDLVEVNP